MIDALQALGSRIAAAVTRGVVALAGYSPTVSRIMIQVSGGIAGETLQNVELIQPYGRTANPDNGAVIVLTVNGHRDHKVALGADNPACRIAGLVPGEFGDQDNQGQQIVFKRTGIVINSSLPITINSGGPVTITGSNISLNP
jgi:phage gp45-like